jgi:hypothetical protein
LAANHAGRRRFRFCVLAFSCFSNYVALLVIYNPYVFVLVVFGIFYLMIPFTFFLCFYLLLRRISLRNATAPSVAG